MFPFFKAKMGVSRELLIKLWMPTRKGDWNSTLSLAVSLARDFLACPCTTGGGEQKLGTDGKVRDYQPETVPGTNPN